MSLAEPMGPYCARRQSAERIRPSPWRDRRVCDDIRQGIGNKFSLIGCYGPLMYINTFPAVLPKLCVQVKVHAPADRPFAKLILRVLRDDQQLIEMPATEAVLASARAERPGSPGGQFLNALLVMLPFPVEGPCLLRVEAETEEGTLDGGALCIEPAPTRQ